MNCLHCEKDCFLRGCPIQNSFSDDFVSCVLSRVSESTKDVIELFLFLSLVRKEACIYVLNKVSELAQQGKTGYQELFVELSSINVEQLEQKFPASIIEALRTDQLDVLIDFLDQNSEEIFFVLFFAKILNPLVYEALTTFMEKAIIDSVI